MKVLHTADWHLNDKLGRQDRTDHLRQRVKQVALICDHEAIDVLVVAGDLFSELATAVQVTESFKHLRRTFAGFFARGGIVLGVTGNHDQDGRVRPFIELARSGMDLAEPPRNRGDRFLPGKMYLLDMAFVGRVHDPRDKFDVQFVLLPFPSHSRLLTGTETATTAGQLHRSIQDTVGNWVRDLPQMPGYDPGLRTVLVAHLHVSGADVGRGMFRVSEENDVILDAAALPTGFDYIALGHVHKPQCLRGLPHVRYAGSLDRMDFSERDEEKGVVLVDLGPNGRSENAVSAARRELTDAVQAVPALYRENAPADNARLLAEELKELEVSSAERDYASIAEDRTLQAERVRQLDEAERQLASVPEDARRPASEVLPEVTAAELALQAADELRRTAADGLARLNRQRADRQEAEQRLATEERNHTLHDRLAGLLGDRGIQLDLVRDAERQIIELANDVLVRVSSGDLRFDPPDPTSERPFDLTIRRVDCPGPIAMANLSGGQRFRVAVSLALAVCRFANGERRPLESVIIDEGFGCLDRDGRMAMIAELRDGQALSRMFKKVLVVSHQEDFAAAFPVGYRLRSEGGMTTVESFGLQDEQ